MRVGVRKELQTEGERPFAGSSRSREPLLTKPAGSGRFESAPAVWTIANGKPALLNR
jgi:hypothetical protein